MIERKWVSREEAEKYLPEVKMTEWKYEEFEKKFPHLFTEGTYFECDTGWKDIIWNLCEQIEPLLKKMKEDGEENIPYVEQVKEKFGTLAFYMTATNSEIDELIDDARRLSCVTCEVCGCPGKIRRRHWIKTLCESCL